MFVEYDRTDDVEEALERLEAKLAELRQAIIGAERSVLVDGRFEQMILSPYAAIDVAVGLITELAAIRRVTKAVAPTSNRTSTSVGSDFPRTR